MPSDFIARVRKKKLSSDGKRFRWVVDCEETGPDGKRKKYEKRPIINSEKEAKALRDSLISARELGIALDLSCMLVSDFLDKWLNGLKVALSSDNPEVKYSTYRMYEYLTRLYIKPRIGSVQLSKLRPTHIQDLYDYCRDELNLKSPTIRHLHSTVHRALAIAVKRELIASNPAEKADPPKQRKFRPEIAKLEHLLTLINLSKDKPIFPALYIAINTGMRRGEVAALRWSSVNLKDGTLKVIGTMQRQDGVLAVRTPKTEGSVRTIKLTNGLLFFLTRLKAQHDDLAATFEAYSTPDFVCSWPDGRPMDPDFITKHFHRLVVSLHESKDPDGKDIPESEKFPLIRFHDLRHAFASLLLREGVEMKIVSDILGHSSIRITADLYSHVLLEMQNEAMKALDDALTEKKRSAKSRQKNRKTS